MTHHEYAKLTQAIRVSGNTEYETICPECQHEGRKFHIQITDGIFHCKHCEFKGIWHKQFRSVDTEELAPEETLVSINSNQYDYNYVLRCNDLLNNTKDIRQLCLNYLSNKRHLSLQTINAYKIGYDNRYIERLGNSFDCIVLPEIRNGKVISIDWRLLSPPTTNDRYDATPGPRQLFNLQSMELDPKQVILTEGRIDALSAIQMSPGMPVVGLPNKELSDKFVPIFQNHEKIWLATDNTGESQQSAEKIAEKLGSHRVYRVIYPAKDVNELLGEPNAQEIWLEALNHAKPFRKLLCSFGDYSEQAVDFHGGKEYEYIETGIPHLDQISGGIRPGELVVLSGIPGCGKSTLASILAANVAKSGIKVAIGSFEEKPFQQYMPQIISYLYGANIAEPKMDDSDYKKMLKATNEWGMLYFINEEDKAANINDILNSIHIGYKEGIRVVILDHLHYFVKPSENERNDIDNSIRALNHLIKHVYKDLTIILLCHLRKLPLDYRTGLPQRANLTMLKGSSNIEGEAHMVWILNRDPITKLVDLEVAKIRSYKTFLKAGGRMALNFDKKLFGYRTGILNEGY